MSLSQAEEQLLAELTINDTEEEQKQVRELVEAGKKGEGTAAGATDLINLTLSIGSPVPRILFSEIIKNCDLTDREEQYYLAKIKKIITPEVGCMQTGEFTDIHGNRKMCVLVYKECDDNHHIENELDRILRSITLDKSQREKYREMFMKQLQQLVRIGHGAYCHMLESCDEVFDRLDDKYPDEFQISELQYNSVKAEFFVNISNTKKVGIYIECRDV